jgi:hypothetical protein
MAGASNQFSCRACGHVFSAPPAIIAKQPTCPKCRTFGQLTDASGRTVGAVKQNVVRVQHPGSAPYASTGAHGYGAAEDDYVEVSAEVAYGGRDKKSLVTTLILVGLGIGMVITLFFIVSVMAGNPEEEGRQRREVVQDPKDLERGVDEAVAKVRNLLKAVPGAEVQETTDFDEAIKAIQASGGAGPGWSAPPKPGTPFRVHGFTISAPLVDRNNPDRKVISHGFVMLLYYKTADEVKQAGDAVNREIGGDKRNYSIYTNPAVWYVTYGGYDYGGVVKDSVDKAMKVGAPILRQFTDRTGSTLREDLK